MLDSPALPHRCRRLVASDAFLAMFFGGGEHHYRISESPIPADARIVHACYDGRSVTFVVESEAFDPVPEGEVIPEIRPVFTITMIRTADPA